MLIGTSVVALSLAVVCTVGVTKTIVGVGLASRPLSVASGFATACLANYTFVWVMAFLAHFVKRPESVTSLRFFPLAFI